MTDNIIDLKTGAPIGSSAGSEDVADNLEAVTVEPGEPAPNMWQRVLTKATQDGAIMGVLLYVNHEGEIFFSSVGADRASIRGLIEEARDDLRAFRGQ